MNLLFVTSVPLLQVSLLGDQRCQANATVLLASLHNPFLGR